MTTVVASYLRSFGLFGTSARFDAILPYQTGRWEGLLDGVPTTVHREGFDDPRLRLSVNLLGAPALPGPEWARYQAGHPENTIVGAAVAVVLPLGDYLEDKLLNLGENRYAVTTQTGIVHTRGPWSVEVTGSLTFYTDNDEFWNGRTLEQDPRWGLQSHVIHVFRPGLWAAASGAYLGGAASTVDGVEKDDGKGDLLLAPSFGFPVSPIAGVRLAYLYGATTRDVGMDSHTGLVTVSVRL
jgi:hypothetical protein